MTTPQNAAALTGFVGDDRPGPEKHARAHLRGSETA
jgi:hypothetical protein